MARFSSGWRYHPLQPGTERLLVEKHGLAPVAARVLAARGIGSGLAEAPPAWLALPVAFAVPEVRRIVARLQNANGPIVLVAAPDPDSLLAVRVLATALGPERVRTLLLSDDAAALTAACEGAGLLVVFAPLVDGCPAVRSAVDLPELVRLEVLEPTRPADSLCLAAARLPDPWKRLAPAGLALLLGLAWRFRDAPWSGKRIVVYDIETTGLAPEQDRVIEVAALALVDGEVVGRYESLCRVDRPLPPRITELTGIADGDLVDAPPEAEALAGFVRFLEGADFLSGHNCTDFDNRFILARTKALGIPLVLPPLLDTLHLSRRHLRGLVNHKLGTVAAALGFDGEGYHRAGADTAATAHCLLRLLLLAHPPCRELIDAVRDELCLAGALPDSGPGNRALSALGRSGGSAISDPVRAWIRLAEAILRDGDARLLAAPLAGEAGADPSLFEGPPPFARDKETLLGRITAAPDALVLEMDGPRPLAWLALLAYALPLDAARVHGLYAAGCGVGHLVLASFAEARLERACRALGGARLGSGAWPGLRLLVLDGGMPAEALAAALTEAMEEPALLEFEARYAADNPELPRILAGIPELAPWSPGFPGPVLLIEEVAREMLRHEGKELLLELPGLLSRIALPPARVLPEGSGPLDLVLAWRGGGQGALTARLLDVRPAPFASQAGC